MFFQLFNSTTPIYNTMSASRGKNLVDVLGIKSGYTVAFLNTPYGYDKTLGTLPEYVEIQEGDAACDFIQFFVRTKKDLEVALPLLTSYLKEDGVLWISWPKQTSSIHSEINEDEIQDISRHYGLSCQNTCSIDDDWSGVKLLRVKLL